MRNIGKHLHIARLLVAGFLGLSISMAIVPCQAYFKGAPAYNSNYRPIYAHQGVEVYVDLASIHIMKEDNKNLEFTVLTAFCEEDADMVTESGKTMHFLVNKSTRQAWIWAENKQTWMYLDLNRTPYGYEESSFTAVNLCYAYLHGEFLNDSSGDATAVGGNYKGN
ncbi:hypothetical protein SAMN05660742_11021 [Propionispira arboris]|uniref:Uncharacterized protein n=1 Tax=Propionispira arboris TaxID=84035 RepID=A0A1H6ZLZ5_9FIRM|nr:hypothetical protein [Propionispira arboris]SEJ54543.1 hypothetical protein SAMN05660742_11021 [Propionispira arboris]